MKLDKYEEEILNSVENGEWNSIENIEEEKKKYAEAAKATSAKNKRINIRLSEKDLINLKARSIEEGLPYQTLVSSIIHKYISGKLKEI